MNSNQINSFEDLWEWLEINPPLYDDVAKDIFRVPSEIVKKTYDDKVRKEKRRIRRKMGRQQRAIQKYVKINDEMPF